MGHSAQSEVLDNSVDNVSPRWDISQERAFLENLLNTRFNFLVTFSSVVVAGAINIRGTLIIQALLLTVGAVIAHYVSLVVGRAQEKLDIILEFLIKNHPEHPAAFTNRLASQTSRRQIIGYTVPRFCSKTLRYCAIAAWIYFAYSTVSGAHSTDSVVTAQCINSSAPGKPTHP